ncbi:MAG: M23 family metallopeptidase [Candidatus Marinimicrobia bacterium]|nr:M23 family metallopeptidase [Candidatus Neomarinimicrobiota bacterium]
MNRFIIFSTLLLGVITAQSYTWPTDAGKSLKSNYGEFRHRHFHMGIDIKTGEKEGASVFAVEGGYVSRMVANFKGYGQALYIIHPDGKTSVYAHLSQFNPKLERFLKYYQNMNESYLLNHYFEPNEIKVNEGELIGYTGNTGYSFGPHLHFEIRNENEQPLNPQTNGFTIDDRQSPKLNELAIIPLAKNSRVNGSLLPVQIPFFRNSDGSYELADTLNIFGPVGLAFRTKDKRQGFSETYQLKTIELIIDGKREYKLDFEVLDYSLNDHVQLVRNHGLHRLNLGSFHNLFHLKENPKSTVQPDNLSGILKLPPGYHKLIIKSTDANGNSAEVSGWIFTHPPIDLVIQETQQNGNEITFSVQSKSISIPLKNITCYSFSPSGFADKKIDPLRIDNNDGGLMVTLDMRRIQDRSLQFIAKNRMGTFSKPLHWHPQNIAVDYNAKPDIKVNQTAAGIIVQIETGNMGTAKPTLILDTPQKLTNVVLEQIQPYTYISEALEVALFKDVTSLNVSINNGTNYTYKYAFKPALAKSGEQAVVVSEDEMCSLQSLKTTFYDQSLIWIDAVENSVTPSHGKFLSNVYQLQPFDIPLQDTVRIGIRYDENAAKLEKTSLYYYDQDDGWTYIQSKDSKKRQVLTGSLKSLEAVCILQDNIPPVIKSTFPAHGGHYYTEDVHQLQANVDDLLSGIAPEETSMTMTLNGKRLLYAFQPVSQTISYNLLDRLTLGNHTMTVSVNDRAGNSASSRIDFVIK